MPILAVTDNVDLSKTILAEERNAIDHKSNTGTEIVNINL